MMGWLAVCYGIAAAFALAISCCGPSHLAKIAGAYLFGSWLLSNKAFGKDLELVMEAFTYIDFFGASCFLILYLRTPLHWIGLILVSTVCQLLLHLGLLFSPPTHAWHYWNIVGNNALYVVQLIAVCIPTALGVAAGKLRGPRWPLRPRRERPNLRVVKIKPPYPGWEPPAT